MEESKSRFCPHGRREAFTLGGVSDEGIDEAVARLPLGDEWAFRTVYRAVHPPLVRYLSVLVGPEEAEDVASETWGQAFRDIGRFTGDADGFRGWVTTIGRNRALDHLRARQRRPVADCDDTLLLEMPARLDVAEHALVGISTQTAVALIASLPQEQAEAVMLRAVLGLDAKAAGEILGKRPGAVRVAAHRGLKTLARILAESGVAFEASNAFEPQGAEEVR